MTFHSTSVLVSRAPLLSSIFARGFVHRSTPRRSIVRCLAWWAIKLLYCVENPEVVPTFGGNTDKLERELESMTRRKFKFVVSMQRYSKFNQEEHENAEFLLRAYPRIPDCLSGRRASTERWWRLGTLNSSVTICKFNSAGQLLNGADGCYFLTPVFSWIEHCIISILLVFTIAFLSLFLQGEMDPEFYTNNTQNLRMRNQKSNHLVGKATLFTITRVRGFLHTNLLIQ